MKKERINNEKDTLYFHIDDIIVKQHQWTKKVNHLNRQNG